MAVVELDIALFKEVYPYFDEMSENAITFWWDYAQTIIDNSENSLIPYDPPNNNVRKSILYALLCHLCLLSKRGQDSTGRTISATQGSVSVTMSNGLDNVKNGEWWTQTQCGASAFEALSRFKIGGLWFAGQVY